MFDSGKSPQELYRELGPHAVDELVRHAMNSCWRKVPAERRSFEAVVEIVETSFGRNLAIWRGIDKPMGAEELGESEADGLFRQAFLLAWQMLPSRELDEVEPILQHIYRRNLQAWKDDQGVFGGKAR